MRTRAWLGVAALAVGCTGFVTDPDPGNRRVASGLGIDGLRRLTRAEIDQTLAELLLDSTRPAAQFLPSDATTPFDNDLAQQQPSTVLIEGLEALATDAAARWVADASRRDAVVGCQPDPADDSVCLRSFIRSFGRRALRRPLTDGEVDSLFAFRQVAVDFDEALELVVAALLQDPELVYRVEIGAPSAGRPGVRDLGRYEIATRLSFLIWGGPPDDALLDRAEAGELDTAPDRQAIARELLGDERARDRMHRFHSLWLGYERLRGADPLSLSMVAESDALVDRAVWEKSWLELFLSSETFLDASLAEHYGLPAPAGGSGWVSYGASGRGGVLSHGSFLSIGAKFGDTSPTQRGQYIRSHLMCDPVPPPPPTVNVDQAPTSPKSACKWDRYAAHRENSGCASCHDRLDPIGFGLEKFDARGRYRASDPGHPECAIAGEGEVVGEGSFAGPAELGQLLVDSGTLDVCAATQLFRFAWGRQEQPDDQTSIQELAAGFAGSGHRFDSLLVDLVGLPAFAQKREE